MVDCAGGRFNEIHLTSLCQHVDGERETERKLATNRRVENHVAGHQHNTSAANEYLGVSFGRLLGGTADLYTFTLLPRLLMMVMSCADLFRVPLANLLRLLWTKESVHTVMR